MSIPNSKRVRTPEQLARWHNLHAQSLLSQILHWLDAAANYVDLREAPKTVSPAIACSRNLADHSRRVRLVPRPPRALQRLECTMLSSNISEAVLNTVTIQALRQAGYTVSRPAKNRCGCLTFSVLPKQRTAKTP